MWRPAFLVIVLLSLMQACCPLTSVNPISDPQKSTYDQRLTGTWRNQDENEAVYFHIGQGEGGRIRILAVEHSSSGKFDHALFNVFATRINKTDYLNIDLSELSKEITLDYTGFIFVRYDLPDADTLTFAPMALDPVVEAIQAKKLAGELTYADKNQTDHSESAAAPKVECAKITDSSDHIRAYLADEARAKELFSNLITMKRVK